MTRKTFFLDQHGCAKNQVDGELIIAHLTKAGFERTLDAQLASIIIVNSCGFIEDAKKESIASIMTARQNYPNAKILLAGCLAERYANVLKDDLQEVDGFFGNGDISKIVSAVEETLQNKRPVKLYAQKGVSCGERTEFLSFLASAYVKITEGCNNHCSFCAIPLIRGNLRSRPIEEIVQEVQSLVAKGFVEINLIGQDLASYGRDFDAPCADGACTDATNGANGACADDTSTADNVSAMQKESQLKKLLRELSSINGDFVIRLLYMHPDNFPLDILPLMQKTPKILPYFDIPFQSGDDKIILSMNRKGSAKTYIQLVKTIKEFLPNAVLRTTFLVGYPAETDEQHANTAAFLSAIKPDWSGCFAYSKEEDTPASLIKKNVSKKVCLSRVKNLQNLQEKITAKRLLRHVDTVQRILIEEIVPLKDGEETGFFIGRAWFQAPEVDGACVISYDATDCAMTKKVQAGTFVNARITGATSVDLQGFML